MFPRSSFLAQTLLPILGSLSTGSSGVGHVCAPPGQGAAVGYGDTEGRHQENQLAKW